MLNSKTGSINQILSNLIMNSIMHGFEGKDHGRISIIIMPLSNQLSVLFKDDDLGVDESIKHKVFEPFTTIKRGEGGSGLGLHLVYNLALNLTLNDQQCASTDSVVRSLCLNSDSIA
jgi:signal transduction histidine kinase